MKKRPVALLEVLIALSLVAICAVPLIRQPIANHQAEMAQIERIETGRIAACTFAEVREKFLKKEIRWKQIPNLKTKSAVFAMSDSTRQLPPLPEKPIKRSFTLETLHLNVGKNPFTYRITVYKS
jgi:hypothetical protein